nr:MAG: hypothetical protein [Bacteriophage sp.]
MLTVKLGLCKTEIIEAGHFIGSPSIFSISVKRDSKRPKKSVFTGFSAAESGGKVSLVGCTVTAAFCAHPVSNAQDAIQQLISLSSVIVYPIHKNTLSAPEICEILVLRIRPLSIPLLYFRYFRYFRPGVL